MSMEEEGSIGVEDEKEEVGMIRESSHSPGGGSDGYDRDRDRDYHNDSNNSRDDDGRSRRSNNNNHSDVDDNSNTKLNTSNNSDNNNNRYNNHNNNRRETSLFVGNINQNIVTVKEIEDYFSKYKVTKVDLKSGYAFVFILGDPVECVNEFNQAVFMRRRIKVEIARGDGNIKRREEQRREETVRSPNDTLFVVNFDPRTIRLIDLEKAFGVYGKLLRVDVKKNFAFVQYGKLEEAIKAKNDLNHTIIGERMITVEYVAKSDQSAR